MIAPNAAEVLNLVGVVTGTALSAMLLALVLHVQTVVTGDPAPSSIAFLVLTVCYGLIILALGVLTRTQAIGQRVLWVLALTLFAVSASHLGRRSRGW